MAPERLGPYRILSTLGRGGMGTVFEAVNTETGDPAAVKVLASSMSGRVDFRQRFQVEIDTLRKLRHLNIVRLFGFGEQEGQLFYGMELVDGSSLEQLLQTGRQFGWREVTRIGIETCRALRHAHDRGVVHRDIKPANLLLSAEGPVKLSDFGIARLFGNTSLTAVGNVLGTVEFMSPEQANGRPAGPRSDLYSLGGVLFTLLAGRPPFRASSPLQMLEKQRSTLPEPVRRYAPHVPVELEGIISQLLDKEPEKRIPNATLLLRRLELMRRALADVPDSAETDLGRTVHGQDELSAPTPCDGQAQAELPEDGEVDPVFGKTLATEAGPRATKEPAGEPPEEVVERTRATSAFHRLGVPGANALRTAIDAEAPEAGTNTSGTNEHFVAVPEEELGRIEGDEPARSAWVSPQTWVLAVSLICMGLVAWWFLRPPSAEDLYQRITARVGEGNNVSLLEAKGDIVTFLSRHADDPRYEEVRELRRAIDLDALEKQLERGNAGVWLPIERTYREALFYEEFDPERAIEKLLAITVLYEDHPNRGDPTGMVLELARRRLAELNERVETYSVGYEKDLLKFLDVADQLDDETPGAPRAAAIRRAVIELAKGKSWASDVARRAREALELEDVGQP